MSGRTLLNTAHMLLKILLRYSELRFSTHGHVEIIFNLQSGVTDIPVATIEVIDV